jgi:hypothetical protein
MEVVDITSGLQIEVIQVSERQLDAGAVPEGAVEDQIDKIVDGIRLAFERIPRSVRELAADVAPDEFEVEFGLSLSGELKVVFVGAQGGTTFKVKAVWKKPAVTTLGSPS